MKRIDLTARRFGRLTVIGFDAVVGHHLHWHCLCDCGGVSSVRGSALKTGNTISCGCAVAESMAKIGRTNGTHRMSRTREYHSWSTAKYRCYNPKSNKYQYYGARGIGMCERWLNSFEDFVADMGPRPNQRSLDRYPDLEGNYEPGNCRWATASQQNKNRRSRKRERHHGI